VEGMRASVGFCEGSWAGLKMKKDPTARNST